MIKDIIFAYMYSIEQIRAYREQLWFVYSLSYNGQVFYIGVTVDLVKRYKTHLDSPKQKAQNKTTLFIKNILDNGGYPEINIIDRLQTKEAFELEGNLIRYVSKMNQPLTNRQFKRAVLYSPKNIPEHLCKADVIKIIKFKQCAFIHQNTQPHKVYTEYPNEPFKL